MQNNTPLQQETFTKEKSSSKKDILSIFNSLILTCSTLGFLFGGVIIFDYCKKINQLGVFANVLTQPQALIVITVVFIMIIVVFIGIPVITPYVILQLSNYKTFWICHKHTAKNHPPILSSTLFLTYASTFFWGYINVYSPDIFSAKEQSFMMVGLILVSPIIIAYMACRIARTEEKKPKERIFDDHGNCFSCFKLAFLSFIYFVCAVFSLVLAYNTSLLVISEKNDSIVLAFFGVYLVLLCVNVLLALISAYQRRNWVDFYAPTIVIPAFIILILLVLSGPIINIDTQLSSLALRIPHFIETPNDSKYYRFSLESSVAKALIQQYGEIFNSKFICSTTNNKNCSSSKQQLTLYGYMAWNLGNKKVLCPKTVNAMDKVQSKDCIVITATEILRTSDTSYLQ